jgi:hypothetical protein
LADWINFYDKSKVSSYKLRKWPKKDRQAYEQMMTNAETEIEQLIFNDITAKPNLQSAKEYFKRFPKGIHNQQVKILTEPLFYKDACKLDTVKAYKNYLTLYPTGFSSGTILTLLEKAIWRETEKKNTRRVYTDYIKKYPNSTYSQKANDKLTWMKANPATPKIDFPKEIVGQGSPPRFSWVTRFSEGSGKVGYSVSGSGWVIDLKGGKWGPSGHKGNRGTIKVKPGGKGQDSHWVRGRTFCGGRLEYVWVGEDDNGHKIKFYETIYLKCK